MRHLEKYTKQPPTVLVLNKLDPNVSSIETVVNVEMRSAFDPRFLAQRNQLLVFGVRFTICDTSMTVTREKKVNQPAVGRFEGS